MKKNIFVYLLVVGLILSSCNLPGDPAESQEQIMTAAAMTVQSALLTPLASPTASTPMVDNAGNTPVGTTPPVNSPTVSTTPTNSSLETPMASVSDVINCRSGPSKSYKVITQLVPNQKVQIIGFLPPNFWVVSTQLGDCWLSGEFATPSGNVAAVPTVTAPPTPEGDKPDAPTLKNWTYNCAAIGQTDVVLTWNDKANDETGYRIFRNNELAADLPANSTNFSETIPSSGANVVYQIQVYNLIGESSLSVSVTTCP